MTFVPAATQFSSRRMPIRRKMNTMGHTYAMNFVHCVFQHQRSPTADRPRTPSPSLRVLQWHRHKRGIQSDPGGRYRQPCSPSRFAAAEISAGTSREEAQRRIVALDGSGIWMAGGIRRIRCQPLAGAGRAPIHPEPGEASPPTHFRGGICRTPGPLRRHVRPAIRVWLAPSLRNCRVPHICPTLADVGEHA